MRGIRLTVLLSAMVLLVIGCDKQAIKMPDDVLVRLDGKDITTEYAKTVLGKEIEDKGVYDIEKVRDMVRNRIVAKDAINKGVLNDPEYNKRIVEFKMDNLPDVIVRDVYKNMKVEDSDLPAPETFGSASLDLSVINTPTMQEAEDALKELKAGAKFEDVAKKRSKGLAAESGGSVGWRNLTFAEFDNGTKAVLNGLEAGQLSPILKSEVGYSIFLVKKKKTAEQVRQEGKETIEKKVKDLKIYAEMARQRDILRSKVKIEINPEFAKGNTRVDWAAKIDGVVINMGSAPKPGENPHEFHGAPDAAMQQKQLLQMIDKYLFAMEAIKRGLESDAIYQQKLQAKQEEIIASIYLDKFVMGNPELTEADMKNYYEKNKQKYFSKETVWLSRILCETEADAKKALAEIKSGKSFPEVAKAMSKDASASRGGVMGAFAKEKLREEYVEPVSGLKVGDVSGIIKTEYGFEILKLDKKLNEGYATLDSIRPILKKRVLLTKRSDRLMAYINATLSNHKIVYNPKYFKK